MSKPGSAAIVMTSLAALLFGALLLWWLLDDHYQSDLVLRKPGMDNRPKQEPRSDSVIIGEFYDSLGIIDGIVSGEWPRFRGIHFDNISRDSTPLAESWDSAGPPVVWKVTLGEGYAGAAVSRGRVYVMDYNERRKADMLRCFSLKSGTELWRRWYYADMKRNHGYSRTIPAVTDDYLVTIGPRSHVMCVNPVSGDLLWTIDLEKEYGIPGDEKGRITPDFYSGQCPLIDNGVAILAPGGRAIMTGVDCATGKVLWETPNPDLFRMSHGSIIPMIIHGRRMYVYNAVGGVIGVSAEDADRGQLLWETKEWSPPTTAASPLLLEDNEIAVFGSYGAGGARIKIGFDGSEFTARVVESHRASEGIASDQQTPIIKDGHIWSVAPENAGPLKKQLVCYAVSDLTKPVWTSGKENRFGRGLGPYIISGDRMFLLDDDANLFLLNLAGPSATIVSKARITTGVEAWGPMAIAGRYLIMRDSRTMVCLDIGKN
ncbi:MAG: PQQ-binding-like beta-propeller repeat protein [Bacteroidales bacterium]|nr:PQQ-binding-like beta-propeller repeat protein [Bacteroidales bacterium]